MLNGNRTKSNRGRSPRDLYTTPIELAVAALNKMWSHEHGYNNIASVLDAGCGSGIWGDAMMKVDDSVTVDGIDLVPTVPPYSHSYHRVITGDFLEHTNDHPHAVIGNPPYSLAEEFIRHAYSLVQDGGYVYFLLRLSFLEGIKRAKGLFKVLPLKAVYVCARRPSFFSVDGKHTTDTLAYAMFLWQKGYNYVLPDIDWLEWDY